jgi:hypothetical protein
MPAKRRNATLAEFLKPTLHSTPRPLEIRADERFLTTHKGLCLYRRAPAGHLCPTYIPEWDFRSAHQGLFDEIYRIFPAVPVTKGGEQSTMTVHWQQVKQSRRGGISRRRDSSVI